MKAPLLIGLLLVSLAAGAVAHADDPPAKAGPTGKDKEERNYDMWEDDVGGGVAPGDVLPDADEIPTGNVKKPRRPKPAKPKEEEPFMAPEPEFDPDAVKDPKLMKDGAPETWQDVTEEELKLLRGEGRDPLAPIPVAAPSAPPPGGQMTLEGFIAELNTKITAYDLKKTGQTGCDKVTIRSLAGGLVPEFRLDFTGDLACTPIPTKNFPEPLSDELKTKQHAQLDLLRTVLESLCREWKTFAFDPYILIPVEGDVRLIETENGYYRVSWNDEPIGKTLGPIPKKYSDFQKWRQKKKMLDQGLLKPNGKDIYVLIRTDRSEITRLVRPSPGSEIVKKEEEFRFELKRGYNLLSFYRYIRPDHRATGRFEYVRKGEYFVPSTAWVNYFPQNAPGVFTETTFEGCDFNRPIVPVAVPAAAR